MLRPICQKMFVRERTEVLLKNHVRLLSASLIVVLEGRRFEFFNCRTGILVRFAWNIRRGLLAVERKN
jgi:hypothetical protein